MSLCNHILDKAVKSGFDDLEIDISLYWDVDNKDSIDLKTSTPDLIVCDFLDDWNGLKEVLDGKNPPTIIDFDRLGNVIKKVGNEINKSKKPY